MGIENNLTYQSGMIQRRLQRFLISFFATFIEGKAKRGRMYAEIFFRWEMRLAKSRRSSWSAGKPLGVAQRCHYTRFCVMLQR